MSPARPTSTTARWRCAACTTTPGGERAILWLYWLISGYGLRALRSLSALLILGVIVTTALTGWGLAATAPITTPLQSLAGTVTTTPHRAAMPCR